MNNNFIFVTQITSVFIYIGTLFGLYRLLVNQKDATIEALKTTIESLKQEIVFQDRQLSSAKENDPDLLLLKLKNRVDLLTEELEKTSKDNNLSDEIVRQKREELNRAKKELSLARAKIQSLHEISIELISLIGKQTSKEKSKDILP